MVFCQQVIGYSLTMKVQDLETAIEKLSPDELKQFSEWFDEYMADQWDRQIEIDILAGKLDAHGKVAEEHLKAGRCTPL